jgi:hypothetical protein
VDPLKNFMKVAATLSLKDFLQQFPHPFFFYSETPGAVESFFHTRLVERSAATESIDRFSEQVLDFIPLMPNPHPSKDFPVKSFIGRDSRRDYVISHSTVSNRHACLIADPNSETYKIVDSGSTNGTSVRGKQLEPGNPVTLRDGDIVTFGRREFMFFSPKGAYRFLHQFRLFREALNK